MPYEYDPEYHQAIEPMLPAMAAAPKHPPYEVAPRRAGIDGMWAGLMKNWPEVDDVEETVFKVASFDGVEINVHRFAKKGSAATPLAAVVYTHGGGYFCLSVPLYRKMIQSYVTQGGVPFFAVEYRSPPEYPFPTPIEDCYAALKWVHSPRGAAELGVDPARIAIMGDSAGGGLAAGVAIMARDRKLDPPLARQVLVNAMLDDRNKGRYEAAMGLHTWTPDDNLTGWAAYIGREKAGNLTADVSPWAAPARVSSVADLPPVYIDVPDLDIFRDENIKYAARHAEAGIPLEMHVYPGLPHSFESFAPKISTAKTAVANRIKFISKL
ncbi:arylesterase/monooxygenase [Fonsecaea pedrosoi]|nr:arylesterase/monooxygenase [Fonsecaea pedrosoi]